MKELNVLGNSAERQAIPSTILRHSVDYQLPDAKGHFGQYGGSFVSETLTLALTELKQAYAHFSKDSTFLQEFEYELKHFVGRPSPVYHAKRWSEIMG
ncbi:MAG: tryptophan synthase subunit beta, partial [Burkholderiaceae bacterium]